MKNLILISIILFCATALSGQNRFNYGFHLEAGMTGKNVNEGSLYDANPSFASYSENGQSYLPSGGFGLWVSYRISRHFEMQTGLSYRLQNVAWYNIYDDRSPASPLGNDSRNDYSMKLARLELPTTFRYYPTGKKNAFNPFVGIGVRPGLFLDGEYTETRQSGASEGRDVVIYDLSKEDQQNTISLPVKAEIGLASAQWKVALNFSPGEVFSSYQNYGCFCGVDEGGLSSYYYGFASNAPVWNSWSIDFSYQLF